MHDGADDPVRTTEDAGRLTDLTGAQVVADHGRGEPFPVADVVEGHDLEAELLAEVGQGRDVAGVAVAEAGVHADDHAAGVEAADEHGPHEVLRGLLGELGGEVEHEQAVDPRVGDQVVADRGGRDELGRLFGPQHRDGVRLEGDRHRRQPEPVARVDEGVEHRPVPTVDAVEVAERDDAGP